MGRPSRVSAAVVDVIEGGFGVNLRTPLQPGSLVVVGEHVEAEVRWCVQKSDGTFRAGLQNSLLDFYEALQLSPNADGETISRVYRLLAARYHPDNGESGDSEKFLRLSEAYRILSDPEKRARYAVRLREVRQLRQQIFERAARSTECGDQVKKRVGSPVGSLSGWNAALRHPGL